MVAPKMPAKWKEKSRTAFLMEQGRGGRFLRLGRYGISGSLGHFYDKAMMSMTCGISSVCICSGDVWTNVSLMFSLLSPT